MARTVLERSRPSTSLREPKQVDTLPKLLRRNAEQSSDRTAFREKDFGIWQRVSWQQYFDHARALGLGLVALGLHRSGVVGIVGDNRPELFYAALGTQCVGGISYGLYQDSLPDQLAQLLEFAEAQFVVCEDQEQVDKILEMSAQLPHLQRIIVEDWRGMWRYQNPKIVGFEAVEQLGRELDREDPGLFDERLAQSRAEDVALFCQTSGTTALPKLAMLSHRNLISQGQNFLQTEPHISAADEFVSYLPFAWIGEQMLSMTLHLLVGFTVNFPEEPETAQRDFREIAPHFTFAPARIYEGLHAAVSVRMLDAGWLRRQWYEWATGLGQGWVELEARGEPIPQWMRLLRPLAYWLVYRPILDKMGFTRMRAAWNGGASLGPDYLKYFRGMGLNLKQIYGQTEVAGISCVHRDGQVRFWTMGYPIANTEIRLTEEGEIICRSPSVFLGYYRNSDATQQALRNGWLHSGDYGALDPSGDIIMFDRMGDVITLADGTKVSPRVIEDMLKFTPFLQEAMVVVSENQRDLATILNIEMRSVGKWAEDRGIAYTSYTDLSQKPEVLELLEGIVRSVNQRVRPEWRINRFVSLYKEFHPDDDELTRTRKLRRRFILDRYRDLIAAIGTGAQTFEAAITIRYEDGRTADIRTTLQIRTIT